MSLDATRPPPTVRLISEAAAHYYGVPIRELLSMRRSGAALRARQVAMYLAKQMTPHSLPEIGRLIGGRDHTTVLHNCRVVAARMAEDSDLADAVAAIETAVLGVGAAAERIGITPPAERDPLAIARRVLDDPRALTTIPIDELTVLAAAVANAAEPDDDEPPEAPEPREAEVPAPGHSSAGAGEGEAVRRLADAARAHLDAASAVEAARYADPREVRAARLAEERARACLRAVLATIEEKTDGEAA